MPRDPSSASPTTPAAPLSATMPLAVGQTVIWAYIFYLFPALLPTWEQDTGWSRGELTGAFTLSLLVAALASPGVGRAIDHGHGGMVMVGGSVLAALTLVGLSQISALWQFYLCWTILGFCMAASLYEPCFAILTRRLGTSAKPAITRITLIAGLAGTLSFPTSAFLAGTFGWRGAVICFALAILLLTVPLTVFALGRLTKETTVNAPRPSKKLAHHPAFWPLAIAFMVISIEHGIIITHLLPLLAERGVATALAVTAASTVGPMQVFGRLVMIASEKHVSNLTTAYACFIGMGIGATCLFLAGAHATLIMAFVVLHGAAYGVTSIIRPVLTREVLGGSNFGLVSGRIGGLFMLGTAVAPYGGTLIWQWGGYQTVLIFAIFLTIIGLVLLAQFVAPLQKSTGHATEL